MAAKPTPRAPNAPSLATQASRAVVWNTLFVPIRIVAELLTTLLKLTLLPQVSYGMLSLVSSLNNGLGTAIDMGTGRALPKYIPETIKRGGPKAMRRLILLVSGAQVALLGVIALAMVALRDDYLAYVRGRVSASNAASSDVARLLGFVDTRGWALIATVLALLAIGIFFDVLQAYLSSFFKQRAWNSVALLAQLLPKILTIAVILLGWDVPGLLLAMVIAPAVATAVGFWQVGRHQREIDLLPQPDDTGPALPAGFMRYCAVSFLMTLTDFVAGPNFALWFVPNLVDVALLVAGVAFVQIALGYLYTPLVGVQVPLFTRVRQGEGGTLLSAYQSIIRLQVLLLVPGAVGVVLLAEPLFALLPNYATSAKIVWVLVPCLFVESLLTTAHNVLIVHERLREIVIARVLTLVVVPLIIVLTPQFGIIGAALAFGLARLAAGAWVTANGVRLLGLRWPWRFTMRVLAASGVMALAVAGVVALLPAVSSATGTAARFAQAGLVLGIAALGGLVLLLALRLFGGLEAPDREQIARLRLPFKRWLLKVI